MKQCEVCNNPIPEDYVNLLCDKHYKEAVAEKERLEKIEAEAKTQTEDLANGNQISPTQSSSSNSSDRDSMDITAGQKGPPTSPENLGQLKRGPDSSIKDPNYQENPEMEDKEQWEANLGMFVRNGVLLWKPTRGMYTFIKNYCIDKVVQHVQYPKFIWKPKIVDVGCGCGVGSNVLSLEADMVWGIDKNLKSIQFAKEAFERVKNGIYYSSQVTFDQIDILTDDREFMKFDVVVAIEVIEHINDWRGFLTKLITKFDNRHPEVPTEYFISTPNRNNKSISKLKPKNPFHVREWSSLEFVESLGQFFHQVELFNSAGEPIPVEEYETTTHTPLLALAKRPKL